MAIIRLSVLKEAVFAPSTDGTLVLDDYRRRRRRGRMEDLPRPILASMSTDLAHYLREMVARHAGALPGDQPVTVMVNGFLFDPKQAVSPRPADTDNPHSRLFHFVDDDPREEIRHHTASWPLGLGYGADDHTGTSGLAVAFGWHSLPGFASSLLSHGQNFYRRAYENAEKAAWVLVNVLRILSHLLPNNEINLFCHSLGSRVVVRALAMIADPDNGGQVNPVHLVGRLGRVVILGGSEYVVEGRLMLSRLLHLHAPARIPPVYNFVSRENDVLDKLAENFGPGTFGQSGVLGHNGLDTDQRYRHWIDLQIDSAALRQWMLNNKGFHISGDNPDSVWDHWYYYTHRGNMAVYRDILRNPGAWDIEDLRAQRIADGVHKKFLDFGD